MIRYARLAAAALPLLGLGTLWAMSDRTYNSGTEWEVPIAGYDPRDYLRGHYVEFSYDWPGVGSDPAQIGPEALCLFGTAPRLDRVTTLEQGGPCAHPLRASTTRKAPSGSTISRFEGFSPQIACEAATPSKEEGSARKFSVLATPRPTSTASTTATASPI